MLRYAQAWTSSMEHVQKLLQTIAQLLCREIWLRVPAARCSMKGHPVALGQMTQGRLASTAWRI